MTGIYKEQKYFIYFILSILVLIASAGVVYMIDKQTDRNTVSAYAQDRVSAEQVQKEELYAEYASSGQRIVEYDILDEYDYAEEEEASGSLTQNSIEGIGISAEEYDVLCRIVQAEAGCEDMMGKILVANVVLNRVADERFPDTISGVVFQYSGNTAQFSPVADGSYYTVFVSEETIEAVNRALLGEDYSEGALYFAARNAAGTEKMKWFDQCLTKLFAYGGHEFFM